MLGLRLRAGSRRGSTRGAVIDLARILTAAHLGMSASVALLLTAIALGSSSRRRALGVALTLLVAAAVIVGSLLRVEARAATALDGAAPFAALAALCAHPGVRRWIASLSAAGLALVSSLRWAGLDALAASHAGWLPQPAARSFALIEGASATLALAAAIVAGKSPRAAIALLTAALAASVATASIALRGARPLPGFVALYVGPFLSLCAAAALLSILSLRTRPTSP